MSFWPSSRKIFCQIWWPAAATPVQYLNPVITVTRIVSFEVGGPSVREIIKSSNPTPKYGCLNHGQVAIRWPWEMKRIRGHPCKLERRPRSRADTRERRLNLKSWYLCVIRSSLESEDGSIEGIDESCYVLLLGNWKSIAIENFIYSKWFCWKYFSNNWK